MARALPLSPSRSASLAASLLSASLVLLAGPARAGSATAESVFNRQATRQQAMSQVPRGAKVTRTVCEELEVGLDNTRYRCTVFYTNPPAGQAVPAGQAASGGSQP